MANSRIIRCGGAPAGGEPFRDDNPLILNMSDVAANTRMQVDDLRVEGRSISEPFLDLLDIAAYVYVADQSVKRGGAGVRDVGERWRRRLFYQIPVRCLDLWTSPEVYNSLTSLLAFLSDDTHEFGFVSYIPPIGGTQQYLDFRDGAAPDADEVIMFSGGLDSLGGAVQELIIERRRTVLVSHRSNPKDDIRHTQLLAKLGEYAGRKPANFRVNANKAKVLNREYTQRSRSFLYAALGATVAHLLGLDRFRFYENGVVSLNLPALDQVVGARATRTTHPRTLAGFSQLFTAIIGKRFTVENPFQWRTKTDVTSLIANAGCGELIGLSTSCAHTWERTKKHTHCGRCSQCIDRRFAVLAANVAHHDPASAYGVDLLTGERPPDQSRVFALAYLSLAQRLRSIGEAEFLSEFGVIARAFRHCGVSTDEALRLMHGLLSRHGQQVTSAFTAGAASHLEDLIARKLPATCLLQLALDSGQRTTTDETGADSAPSSGDIPLAADASNVFRKQGEAWVVRFQGGREFLIIKAELGARYLRELLSCPGKPISAVNLAYVATNRRVPTSVDHGEVMLDEEGYRACQMKCDELVEQIAADEAAGDAESATKHRAELARITQLVTKCKGFGGKARRIGDDLDRFRKSVGNAVRRVQRQINTFNPELGAHFKKCLKVGMQSCYAPTETIRWVTD